MLQKLPTDGDSLIFHKEGLDILTNGDGLIFHEEEIDRLTFCQHYYPFLLLQGVRELCLFRYIVVHLSLCCHHPTKFGFHSLQ